MRSSKTRDQPYTHEQTGVQMFVFNCGTHYSNGHLVILNRLQRKRSEFYVIMFVLAHHNNVLIIVFCSSISSI